MQIAKLSLVALLVGLVAGCATMSEDECRSAEWRTVGFEDGARGTPQTRVGDYRKACAEFGITPDLDAYQRGHDEGVRKYCTRRSGFEKGEAGYNYAGVCPADLEAAFLEGYNAGKSISDAAAEVAELDNRVDAIDREIKELETAVSAAETEMVAKGVGAARRSALLAEIKADQQRIGELASEKAQVLKAQGEAEANLEEVRARYRN